MEREEPILASQAAKSLPHRDRLFTIFISANNCRTGYFFLVLLLLGGHAPFFLQAMIALLVPAV